MCKAVEQTKQKYGVNVEYSETLSNFKIENERDREWLMREKVGIKEYLKMGKIIGIFCVKSDRVRDKKQSWENELEYKFYVNS